MAANLVGLVARHYADDEATDDGNEHRKPVKIVLRGGDKVPDQALEVEELRGGVDEVQQHPCQSRTGKAKQHRESAEHDHARAGAEIAQMRARG